MISDHNDDFSLSSVKIIQRISSTAFHILFLSFLPINLYALQPYFTLTFSALLNKYLFYSSTEYLEQKHSVSNQNHFFVLLTTTSPFVSPLGEWLMSNPWHGNFLTVGLTMVKFLIFLCSLVRAEVRMYIISNSSVFSTILKRSSRKGGYGLDCGLLRFSSILLMMVVSR